MLIQIKKGIVITTLFCYNADKTIRIIITIPIKYNISLKKQIIKAIPTNITNMMQNFAVPDISIGISFCDSFFCFQ